MTVNLLVFVRDHCLHNNQIQIMSVIVNKLMFTTRVIYTMFINSLTAKSCYGGETP
jgi:hypothetical protein